ncbi:MAG: acetylornithine/succinylornithine family transaminase [Solirubrobacterales bacterium]|nr:acetylornithine/succinylornithine family transaminase [Solirubrobacterales bacterium]MCB8970327.1 acetylornithine/succinylornithine family transaminase [Thermoleophilales bacterium]
MPTYPRAPVEFVRGEGCRIWDAEGREYLDFFSGLSVHNAGHCHPRIVAAISEQAAAIAGMSNLFYSEPAMRLTELLVSSSLGGRAFLCNSGAEANECAIKLVRKHAHGRGIERPEIISLDFAFHGRTLAALSATPRLAREDLFGPLPQGFVSVPRDDADALRAAIGPNTAAVMIEPIQGEAGVHPIADEVLIAAREACDEAGALLVFDEIQTGMGRTGTLWASEWTPVKPDVMTAAKALGGGLPVGACVISPELGEGLTLGDHGSTFAGGPICARAAIEALEILSDPELLAASRERGEEIRAGLSDHPAVSDIRGRGLMLGIALSDGVDSREVAAAALASGLVVNAPNPETIRLLPPLVVTADEVQTGVATLRDALDGRG